jgi:hypothetical protein
MRGSEKIAHAAFPDELVHIVLVSDVYFSVVERSLVQA